jgi:hypothetical protein
VHVVMKVMKEVRRKQDALPGWRYRLAQPS